MPAEQMSLQGYNTQSIRKTSLKAPPTDMNLRANTLAPTTILDLQSPRGTVDGIKEHSAKNSERKEARIPYPFL